VNVCACAECIHTHIFVFLFGQSNGVEWFCELGMRLLATLSLTYLNADKAG